jgi:tetratricopeptide (TPR) repeat protein
MKRAGWSLLVVFALALAPAAVRAGVPELLKEADGYYAQRAKPGMADKAIETYQQVLALDDSVADAYWKLARTYYWKGTLEKSDAKAADAYREGIEFAKLGVATDAKSVGAHFWLAVSYGKFGEAKGIMQSLHLVDPLMKEAKISLELDETYQDGGPHRLMCRVYMKLPGFKGGDIDKALEHCRKAIAIGPQEHMNHLYLAEALLQKGDKPEAKKALRKVLELPINPTYAPEHEQQQAEAKKLLAELGE